MASALRTTDLLVAGLYGVNKATSTFMKKQTDFCGIKTVYSDLFVLSTEGKLYNFLYSNTLESYRVVPLFQPMPMSRITKRVNGENFSIVLDGLSC
jgi:hypothetical protein